MGGKRKNMSNTKRRELATAEAGRGAVGKTAVVGVKDRDTRQVRARVVEHTDKPTLQGFVVDGMRGERLTYDQLTAPNGLPSGARGS